ncbi:MAG: hypothetical protein C4K47_05340 [Candidatus Thorarchaeota archaeon]|nr:MAG: hypothetical protein C4K47_05340 [Candidatus Thorarchaeota archaeon]
MRRSKDGVTRVANSLQSSGYPAKDQRVRKAEETGFLPAKNDPALRADSHSYRLLFGFAL